MKPCEWFQPRGVSRSPEERLHHDAFFAYRNHAVGGGGGATSLLELRFGSLSLPRRRRCCRRRPPSPPLPSSSPPPPLPPLTVSSYLVSLHFYKLCNAGIQRRQGEDFVRAFSPLPLMFISYSDWGSACLTAHPSAQPQVVPSCHPTPSASFSPPTLASRLPDTTTPLLPPMPLFPPNPLSSPPPPPPHQVCIALFPCISFTLTYRWVCPSHMHLLLFVSFRL